MGKTLLIDDLFNEGLAFAKVGKFFEALSMFDELARLEPDNVNAWYCKGQTLEQMGRPEAALVSYEKVIAIDPAHEPALFSKQEILSSL